MAKDSYANKKRNIGPLRRNVEGLVLLLAGAALSLGCPSTTTPAPIGPSTPANPDVSGPVEKHVETFPGQGPVRTIEGSKASLVRTKAGAYVSFQTKELTPGHVYTLWWIIMNDPTKCSARPCTPEDVLGKHAEVKSEVTWADGLVAPESGGATFSSFLAKGDVWKPWFGNHFPDPMTAEIHLILNDHGPAVDGKVGDMITSYRTGCTDESLPPPFPDAAKQDGEAGPNKCALVQDVIFPMTPKGN